MRLPISITLRECCCTKGHDASQLTLITGSVEASVLLLVNHRAIKEDLTSDSEAGSLHNVVFVNCNSDENRSDCTRP